MASTKPQKPHVVMIPFPAQGHMNPATHLAKLLHASGFHITFVNIEYTHQRLIKTSPDSVKSLPDFRYETIPDGLPMDDNDVRQHGPNMINSTREHSVVPLKELLIKLNKSSPDVPPVSCIISDTNFVFTSQVTKELGIPEARLFSPSACGLLAAYQVVELVKRGLITPKDESDKTNGHLDTPLDWIPGMKGMRLKDMPFYNIPEDHVDGLVNFGNELLQNLENSRAVIINTFYEFDKEVLDALASHLPNIYTIGPLPLLINSRTQVNNTLHNPSLWKEDTECLDWLDKKDPKSVVYVNFGSIAVMNEEEMKVFASGIANCGFHFLWVLRPGIVKGNNKAFTLPQGFAEETKERGLVVSWCPQQKVLNHPSVGLFLTHAGWNSMLETVVAGVPVLSRAFGIDQNTNSRQVCMAWNNGMQIEENVKGSEVAELIREMMVGEKGKDKREKALEWKKKAKEATSEGGSSYINFDKLINEALLPRTR